jgi:thymidylate kinase
MHIAIEGLDGVGKSSVAKEIAMQYSFLFIEKPMRFFMDEQGNMQNYLNKTTWLNTCAPNELKVWFYGCGNILTAVKFREKNIVTDRHLVSNYYWNADDYNNGVFDFLIKATGIPDYTILLYASDDIRKKRIMGRDKNDKDVTKSMLIPDAYKKMELFLEHYSMPYTRVDNSKMDLEQTVNSISSILKSKNIL